MAEPVDFSQMSDEELDAIINGVSPEVSDNPVTAPALSAAKERIAIDAAKPDLTYGMNPLQLGLAGMGSDFNDIIQGVKEKGQIAFAPEGQAGKDLLAQIASDRKSRERTKEELFSNPEALAGSFAGQAATSALAPARIPAQMVLQGGLEFAKPGSGKPTSIASELLNSVVRGGIAAGTTGIVGKGLNTLGKTAGAATGQYTPEGKIAVATKEAAERLGLPKTTLGQLYPNSPIASVERALPGYPERVSGQAQELRNVLDKPINLPEGEVSNVGGAYVDELANAVNQRMKLSGDKYRAVDQFVAANNLGALQPAQTARVVASRGDPGYEVASDLLGRYGLDLTPFQNLKSAQIAQSPLSFDDFHTMRIATNKALNTLNRGMDSAERMGASIPAENRAAKNYLQQLKTSLDRDAEAWANRHSGNKEALDLYKDATQYYKDVVAPTVLDNPIARKATSRTKGFKSGQEGLSAATSSAGIPMVDRLYPTMTRRGQDMTDVLRNLPDVRATALSRDDSVPEMRGGLSQVLRAVTGHPLTAVETVAGRIPGLRGLSESKTATRLLGARDLLAGEAPSTMPPLQALKRSGLKGLLVRELPRQGVLPRAGWAAGQYPQQALEERARRLSATK